VDDDEARKMVKQRDIQQLKQHIDTLDNVLEDVIPSLESAREGPDGSRNGRPGGEEFDGYRAPVDATEMAGSPVDLLTIGRVSREEVKVERRSHTRSRSGVVFILRDTSGSMVMGEKAKLARDATVSLIKTAQKYDHKVGVIDFAGNAIPHYSDGGQQIISRDYHEFMVESMELKSGGGTDLDAALSAVNSIINARDLHSVPINIYVITDSEIPPVEEEIVSDDPKLNTVWTHSQSHLHRSMRELTERYGGDIYRLRNTGKDELLAEIYEQY
jgi:Mg-chelatase subunit ChlD